MSAKGQSEMRATLAAVLPPTLLLAVLIGLWAWLSDRGSIPSYLLPSPARILSAVVANASVLWRHGLVTTSEAIGGFVLGGLAGLIASITLASSRWLRDSLFPLALVSQAVPIAAITPLIVLLIGRGQPAILCVVAISAFFPMLINMTRGLRAADVDYHELLHCLAASRLQRMRMVELPGALPYFFAALKIGAASSFITAMVGEWIGSNVGLGYLVVISGQYFKIPTLWAAIVVTSALTVLLVAFVAGAERLATPWAPADKLS